jgi:hypothetical protein
MFLQGLLGLPERKGKGMKHQIGCVCVLLLLLVAARLACQSDAQIRSGPRILHSSQQSQP